MDFDIFKSRVYALVGRDSSGVSVTSISREEGGLFIAKFSDGSELIGREFELKLSYRIPRK